MLAASSKTSHRWDGDAAKMSRKGRHGRSRKDRSVATITKNESHPGSPLRTGVSAVSPSGNEDPAVVAMPETPETPLAFSSRDRADGQPRKDAPPACDELAQEETSVPPVGDLETPFFDTRGHTDELELALDIRDPRVV